MNIQWVKIKSWHAERPKDHFGRSTYCGRDLGDADFVVSDTLPAEKSCETCLRIVARVNDDAAKVSAD